MWFRQLCGIYIFFSLQAGKKDILIVPMNKSTLEYMGHIRGTEGKIKTKKTKTKNQQTLPLYNAKPID